MRLLEAEDRQDEAGGCTEQAPVYVSSQRGFAVCNTVAGFLEAAALASSMPSSPKLVCLLLLPQAGLVLSPDDFAEEYLVVCACSETPLGKGLNLALYVVGKEALQEETLSFFWAFNSKCPGTASCLL